MIYNDGISKVIIIPSFSDATLFPFDDDLNAAVQDSTVEAKLTHFWLISKTQIMHTLYIIFSDFWNIFLIKGQSSELNLSK